MTDQRSQLAERYMPARRSDTGIYVVGWYPADLWNAPGDHRRNAAAKLNAQQVKQALHEQAIEIAKELNLRVHPVLVTIPRPRASQAAVEKD